MYKGAHGVEGLQKEGTRVISNCQACQSHLQAKVSISGRIDVPIHDEYGADCSMLFWKPRVLRACNRATHTDLRCIAGLVDSEKMMSALSIKPYSFLATWCSVGPATMYQ